MALISLIREHICIEISNNPNQKNQYIYNNNTKQAQNQIPIFSNQNLSIENTQFFYSQIIYYNNIQYQMENELRIIQQQFLPTKVTDAIILDSNHIPQRLYQIYSQYFVKPSVCQNCQFIKTLVCTTIDCRSSQLTICSKCANLSQEHPLHTFSEIKFATCDQLIQLINKKRITNLSKAIPVWTYFQNHVQLLKSLTVTINTKEMPSITYWFRPTYYQVIIKQDKIVLCKQKSCILKNYGVKKIQRIDYQQNIVHAVIIKNFGLRTLQHDFLEFLLEHQPEHLQHIQRV